MSANECIIWVQMSNSEHAISTWDSYFVLSLFGFGTLLFILLILLLFERGLLMFWNYIRYCAFQRQIYSHVYYMSWIFHMAVGWIGLDTIFSVCLYAIGNGCVRVWVCRDIFQRCVHSYFLIQLNDHMKYITLNHKLNACLLPQ